MLTTLGYIEDGPSRSLRSRPKSVSRRSSVCFQENAKAEKEQEREKQTARIEHLWIILGGEHRKHVTLNNLRILLLAIKGLHVQPDVPLSESNAISLDNGIGKFGPSGDLYLEEQDIEKLIALFSQFNHNRLLFEQNKHL